MTRKIFLIQEDNTLHPMSERNYLNEDRLQSLLERYPDLLAGDQIEESNPRRWLFVAREVGVPGEEDGSDRWSLDHVFIDQDAIPTLVEVKRSTDTRIRREVVGQMLDYAANAVAHWPIETIRSAFEAYCDQTGTDPSQQIAELVEGVEADNLSAADDYWDQVKTNLRAGKIRLIFVADEIPTELRRVVEFLNVQMDPAEVLAVEIKQYVGQGIKTLVPKIIGQTGATTSDTSEKRRWDEPSFLKELESRKGPADAAVARQILEWSKEHMPEIWWGRGKRSGGFIPGITHQGTWHQLIEVWTYGSVEIQFQYMKSKSPPFDTESGRMELLHRLNDILGVHLPEDAVALRPSIPLSVLEEEATLQQFLETLEWAVTQITSTAE